MNWPEQKILATVTNDKLDLLVKGNQCEQFELVEFLSSLDRVSDFIKLQQIWNRSFFTDLINTSEIEPWEIGDVLKCLRSLLDNLEITYLAPIYKSGLTWWSESVEPISGQREKFELLVSEIRKLIESCIDELEGMQEGGGVV